MSILALPVWARRQLGMVTKATKVKIKGKENFEYFFHLTNIDYAKLNC